MSVDWVNPSELETFVNNQCCPDCNSDIKYVTLFTNKHVIAEQVSYTITVKFNCDAEYRYHCVILDTEGKYKIVESGINTCKDISKQIESFLEILKVKELTEKQRQQILEILT